MGRPASSSLLDHHVYNRSASSILRMLNSIMLKCTKRGSTRQGLTDAISASLSQSWHDVQIGKSKWKKILEAGEGVFQNRSQVDLKDKWRNLERQGIVAAPAPRHADGPQPLPLAAPSPSHLHLPPAPPTTNGMGPASTNVMGNGSLPQSMHQQSQQQPQQQQASQGHQQMGQPMMQVPCKPPLDVCSILCGFEHCQCP